MSYLYLLDRIEEGRITVKQAIKEIEKDTQHKLEYRAKKIKVRIIDEGKVIRLPALRFGMIKAMLKICPPFVRFITKHMATTEESNEMVEIVIDGFSELLDLMRGYPPINLIHIKSEENEVMICTK
ncbi:hypothetical protein [Turicibacter sanguinis]|uniref:hypothetical protein n=1 Tax=Turicibacter sanguinis TaxID=154288 RepID=UPI00189A1D0A|nr:hypothetical protein [Turicibacter sanguinis]